MCIAHRLRTIIDADYVCVMDAGMVAEYDRPYRLLRNPQSMFSAIVEATGDDEAQNLKDMAFEGRTRE